jgi:Ca2+-transporting ATPase
MKANSLSFLTLSSAQLLHSITCKSEKHSLFSHQYIKPNKYLKLSLLASFGLQTGTILFPPLRNLLRLTPLGITDLFVVGGCSMLSFLLNEGKKELTGRN